MKTKHKAWLNLLLYLLTVGINTMGAFGVINGLSQKEVSNAYPTLITPSPSTFSIWGLIYILLLISLVFMVVKHQDKRTAKLIDAISLPFWIASVANMLWIAAFCFEKIGLSTLLIGTEKLREDYIIARLAFVRRYFKRVNIFEVPLYRGMTSESKMTQTPKTLLPKLKTCRLIPG